MYPLFIFIAKVYTIDKFSCVSVKRQMTNDVSIKSVGQKASFTGFHP